MTTSVTEMVQPSEVISEEDAARLKNVLQTETKTWRFMPRPTIESALRFVNASPAQGAGETCFVFLPHGHIGVFYYM